MLDYYGSITKPDEEVKAKLADYLEKYLFFRRNPGNHKFIKEPTYSDRYAQELIRRIVPPGKTFSVSGWNMWGFKECIEALNTEIDHDTKLAEKRLALAKIAEGRSDLPRERGIAEMIAKYL